MKKYFTKKKVYPILLSTLLAGCGGGGGSDGGSSSGGDTSPINLATTSTIDMPTKIATNSDGVMAVKVTNPNLLFQAAAAKAIGAATDPNVLIITGLSDQTTKAGTSVELALDPNVQVGPNQACWNGFVGAILEPGESCNQMPVVSGNQKGGSVQGHLVLNVKRVSDGKTAQFPIPVGTTVVNADELSNNAAVDMAASLDIRPNAEATFMLNNIGTEAANGAYIDLSNLPDDLYKEIDFSSLEGGIYYEKKKRIIVPQIKTGDTATVSVSFKGSAQTALNKGETLAAIGNNEVAANPVIQVGGANSQKRVQPKAHASSKPFDAPDTTMQLDDTRLQQQVVITLPKNVKKLTFDGIEKGNGFPDTITITPAIAAGTQLKGGDVFTADVSIDPTAAAGIYDYNVVFSSGGETFKQAMQVMVNAKTILINNATNVVLTRASKGKKPVVYLEVINNGQFPAYLANDVTEQFSVAPGSGISGSLEVVDSTDKPCAGTILQPGESCKIGVQSVDETSNPGIYQLSVIGGVSNVESSNLASISLQAAATEGLNISAIRQLPQEINANKEGYVSFVIDNTDSQSALTLSSLTTPIVGQWSCDISTGEMINPGSTRTVTCTVTGTAGAVIGSDIKMKFNNDALSYSYSVNTEFKLEANLLEQLRVNDPVEISPGGSLTFAIENKSQVNGAQAISLDLSGLGADIYNKLTLKKPIPDGINWDDSTGMVTFDEDMLPKGNVSVIFDLPLSPETMTALKAKAQDINDNASSHVVQLLSNNFKPNYPVLNAVTEVASLSRDSLELRGPGTETISVANLTKKPLSLSIKANTLPSGITVTISGNKTIPSGESRTIQVIAGAEASSGSHQIDLELKDGNDVYPQTISLEVADVPLKIQGDANLFLPKQGGSSTQANIIVQNEKNGGFALYGVSDPAEAFEIKNENQEVISSDKLAISNSSTGNSIADGIPDGGQASISIKVLDHSLATGIYTLYSKEVAGSNLRANEELGALQLNETFDDIQVTPLAKIPTQVLPGKTFSYRAEIENTSATDYLDLKDISLPNGATNINIKDGAGEHIWNKAQPERIAAGQSIELSFDSLLANTGDSFTGGLTLTIETQQGLTLAETITNFNTRAVTDLQTALILGDSAGFGFTPGVSATLKASASVAGLNNYFIDFTHMPAELYAQIGAITINGEELNNLPTSPGKISLGSILGGEDADIGILWRATAGTMLEQYKEQLSANSQNHYITVGAANNLDVYPNVKVALYVSAADTVFEKPGAMDVIFKNETNSAATITQVDFNVDNKLNAIDKTSSTCVSGTILPADGSCKVTLKASDQAAWENDKGVVLTYTMGGNKYTTDAKVVVAKPGVSLSLDNIKRPVPSEAQTAEETVTIKNTGLFKTRLSETVKNSQTLFDYLEILDAQGQPISQADAMSLENSNCKYYLNVNASCTVKLTIGNDTPAGSYTLRLKPDPLNNVNSNTIAGFNVLSSEGQAVAYDEQGQMIDADGVSLQARVTDVQSITVKNMGDKPLTFSNPAVNFAWNKGVSSKAAAPEITNTCDGQTIAGNGQGQCTITIQGVVQDPSVTGSGSGTISINTTNADPLISTVNFTMDFYQNWKMFASSSGYHFTCAIDKEAKLYCWGDNSMGQLGIGDSSVKTNGRPTPVVAGDDGFDPNNVTDVALGQDHACAISHGELYCWGSDAQSQLGLSGTENQYAPKRVMADDTSSFTQNVTSIAAGADHTCAITADNTLYCWGQNTDGQLGINSVEPGIYPSNVPPIQGNFSGAVKQISAGQNTTCAITTTGQLFCWGANKSGQIALQTDQTNKSIPTSVLAYEGFTPDAVRQVSVGGYHVCAITVLGNLYCWGRGSDGQLGIGSETSKAYTKKVTSYNGNALSVFAGDKHTCALKNDQTMSCWGENKSKQSGNVDASAVSTPRAVAETNGFKQGNISSIFAGYYTSCAIDIDGSAYCWGNNGNRQLGVGRTSTSVTSPVRVVEPNLDKL